MGSWIILIDHGIASQPIVEHYSQFVRLARVNPKIGTQGQRTIIKYTDCNRANKRICRRFGEFLHCRMLPVLTIQVFAPAPDFFCGPQDNYLLTPLNATHTLQVHTQIYHHKSHHKSKLIMIMQLINIAIYNNHQDV